MSRSNDAIREHVIRNATLILDNTSGPYFRLTSVAESAVVAHGTRQQFVNALAGTSDPDDWNHSRNGYALAVGQAVRDELDEMLEEDNKGREDTLTYQLLISVLDLADNTQAAMLGENYLPDSADDIEWGDE